MKRRLINRSEDRFLALVLALLLLVSLAIPIYEEIRDIKVPAYWNTPVILFALYAIVRLVGSLLKFHTDVRVPSEVAHARAQRITNMKDFYEILEHSVDQATSRLYLTHIRDSPPADLGAEASGFFDKVIEWSDAEGRTARRIICVRSRAMYDWAQHLAAKTEHLNQFHVRVIDWGVAAPAVNMAIIDEKAVYLALTGLTLDRTRGLGFEDQTATQYFTDYYENLWGCGQDLREWLDKHPWEDA